MGNVGRQTLGLLIAFGLTTLAAALGAVASAGAPAFYAAITKPAWAPAASLFGPVWTVLYLLMAVAAWLVWRAAGPGAATRPLMLYVTQLVLNALWAWSFFRWRSGGWAMLDVIVLWSMIGITLVSFWRVRALAGVLLLPYWVWVGFAVVLTAACWRLNPGVL